MFLKFRSPLAVCLRVNILYNALQDVMRECILLSVYALHSSSVSFLLIQLFFTVTMYFPYYLVFPSMLSLVYTFINDSARKRYKLRIVSLFYLLYAVWLIYMLAFIWQIFTAINRFVPCCIIIRPFPRRLKYRLTFFSVYFPLPVFVYIVPFLRAVLYDTDIVTLFFYVILVIFYKFSSCEKW